jgi:hypothetical protein
VPRDRAELLGGRSLRAEMTMVRKILYAAAIAAWLRAWAAIERVTGPHREHER